MARCEDYPCCGHELGCCPDFDSETGAQLNMVCVCGAKLPINNRSSICDSCLRSEDDLENDFRREVDEHDHERDRILAEEERKNFDSHSVERFDESDIEARFE